MNIHTETNSQQILKPKNNFYNFIINPFSFFNNMLSNPKVMLPLLIMFIANVLFSFTSADLLYQGNNYINDSFIQNNRTIFMVLTVGISVISNLTTLIFSCLFLYFIGMIFFDNISYKTIFSFVLFSQIPQYINLFILTAKNLITQEITEQIQNPTLLDSIGTQVNPFNIWHLFLLGVAIHTMTKMSKTKSFIIILILPILNISLPQILTNIF
ncbi:Yip1 family protein [Acetobacter persici]|uniref:Yip1 family protein n=1 Tax=Acetobacter persici TaxID=1076596 RepID=UPI0036DB7AD4